MKIEFTKNQLMENEPYWFELGITFMKTNLNTHKYLIGIGLFFWSINIRCGRNK